MQHVSKVSGTFNSGCTYDRARNSIRSYFKLPLYEANWGDDMRLTQASIWKRQQALGIEWPHAFKSHGMLDILSLAQACGSVHHERDERYCLWVGSDRFWHVDAVTSGFGKVSESGQACFSANGSLSNQGTQHRIERQQIMLRRRIRFKWQTV